MATFDTFNANDEDWDTYIERMEQYFILNNYDDKKKVPALLTFVGKDNYSLLKDLCAPIKPSTKDFESLVKIMGSHFNPTRNIIVERKLFSSRRQGINESIKDYIATLRKQAQKCEFGSTLEERLRDQLIEGIYDEDFLKRLLAKPDLKLEKAIQMACTLEMASHYIQHFKGDDKDKDINKIDLKRKINPKTQKYNECFRCGLRNHSPQNCWSLKNKCKICGEQGHYARKCRSKKNNFKSNTPTSNFLEAGGSLEEIEVQNFKIGIKTENPVMISNEINSRKCEMKLDTGSAVSIVSEKTFKELFLNKIVKPCNLILRIYDGTKLSSIGIASEEVKYKICVDCNNLIMNYVGRPFEPYRIATGLNAKDESEQLIPDLTMDKAIEIAKQTEAVRMQQKSLRDDCLAETNVNFVKKLNEGSFSKIKGSNLKHDESSIPGNRMAMPVLGNFQATLEANGKVSHEEIYEVKNLHVSLLSAKASEELGFIQRLLYVNSNPLTDPLKDYPELFSGLGKLNKPYKIELNDQAQPYAVHTPRRIPFPLMNKTKQKLKEMEQQGVIEKVDHATDWCSPMKGEELLNNLFPDDKCEEDTNIHKNFNLLSDRQHGFRRSKSTITALTEIIKIALEHKTREYAAIIAVDISAAFDNAWWPALMKRIDEDGVQASAIKLLQSYFDNRRIRFRYSSTEINKKLSKGCPQGVPLSPTLWNILINEILNNSLDDNCETIGYADDITLICWNKTPEQLRKTIDNVLRKINKWCESRKLKLSDEKTKILYLYKCNSDIIVSGSKLIKPVEELKILGVTIKNHRVRSKLDFTPHVNEMIIKQMVRNCHNGQLGIITSDNYRGLREIFVRFGISNRIISDIGTQFTSKEFATFVKELAIKHTFSPPKHPATNRAFENL
ncbi:K02A2.6-like [Cordylochernes scorpioides]|uniref:K02A2.6-like n=1 Tax=Cordylochernes scorpioides TaxID=51811 RepID=A0ABY6JX84_9ARAC|nr:K02A2.6-like [Cordylochernes scorpioides]